MSVPEVHFAAEVGWPLVPVCFVCRKGNKDIFCCCGSGSLQIGALAHVWYSTPHLESASAPNLRACI